MRARSPLFLLSLLAAFAHGQGKLHEVQITRSESGRADYIEVADVNADGVRDVVVSFHYGTKIGDRAVWRRSLLWVDPASGYRTRQVGASPYATVVVLADVLPAQGLEAVFLEPDRIVAVNMLQPGAQPQELARVDTFFGLHSRRLPFADLAADLDGDGRDDLVVPTTTGYALFLAAEGGKATEIDGVAQQWVQTEYASDHFLDLKWTLPTLALADVTGNGRSELVYYLDRMLGVYEGEAGKAPTKLKQVDGSALGDAIQASRDESLARRRLLIADIDNDGRADILTSTNSGNISKLSSWGTKVAVFLNKGGAPQRPDSITKVKGVSIPPRLVDYDGDGDLDLILSTVRTDLATGISAATLKKITLTYEAYPWEGKRYASRPELRRDIDIPLEGSVMEGGVLPFGFLHGDYNGDGKNDFLVLGDKKFEIYKGGVSGGGFLFARADGFDSRPTWTVKAPVTNRARVEDLNGDGRYEAIFLGRQDVVIWSPEGLR